MKTINNLALIQAVRASQIRRNEASKNERKRNYARDLFARYFSKFSKRIYGIHVKKRGIFFKKSEKINKPYHELKYVIGKISKLTNLNDITLQSFRSNSFYIDELRLVNKIVKKEIKKINLKI